MYHLHKGDTFRRTWKWQHKDGSLYDLTGVTASVTLSHEKTPISAGQVSVDAENAVIEMYISHEDTVSFPSDLIDFDVDLTFANGDRKTFATGKIRVSE